MFLFDFVFLVSSPPHPVGVPSFFCFGKCRANFLNDHRVQYESSPANTFNSCTDPMWFLRTAAAFRIGTVVLGLLSLGAWGVNRCSVKLFHRYSIFNVWNGASVGL